MSFKSMTLGADLFAGGAAAGAPEGAGGAETALPQLFLAMAARFEAEANAGSRTDAFS